MTASRGLQRKKLPFACWLAVENRGHPTPCHVWYGRMGSHGYGMYGKNLAHRVAYEANNGRIEGDLTIDHLCRIRECVNPDHLETVSRAENTRRQLNAILTVIGSRRARSVTCKRGHDKQGKKLCPVCAVQIRARHRDKLRSKFGTCAVPGGLNLHSNEHIVAQRELRAEKAVMAAKLYQAGIPTPEIALRIGVGSKNRVYHYLKVAGVSPNRAKEIHQPDTALDTPRADLCTPAVGESGGGVFCNSSHGAVTSAEGQHDHG